MIIAIAAFLFTKGYMYINSCHRIANVLYSLTAIEKMQLYLWLVKHFVIIN